MQMEFAAAWTVGMLNRSVSDSEIKQSPALYPLPRGPPVNRTKGIGIGLKMF